MRAIIQRVSQAEVVVEDEITGKIEQGLLVLLGVEEGDSPKDGEYLADKIAGLRVFDDADGKMNLAVTEVHGKVLVVSQFTLLGDCRKGRRPSFVKAASPELGHQLYEAFCARIQEQGIDVEKGRFRSHMHVHLVNDGPVTLMLDSRKLF